MSVGFPLAFYKNTNFDSWLGSSPAWNSLSKRETHPIKSPHFTANQVSAQGTSLPDLGQPAGPDSYLVWLGVLFVQKFPAGPEKSVIKCLFLQN